MTDLIQDTQTALLQARRHEKDFIIRRQDTYAEQNRQSVATADERLATLVSNPTLDNLKGTVETVIAGVARYRANADAQVTRTRELGLTEATQVLSSASELAHQAETLRTAVGDFFAQVRAA